jgi:hypothetical protein
MYSASSEQKNQKTGSRTDQSEKTGCCRITSKSQGVTIIIDDCLKAQIETGYPGMKQ